MTEFLHALRNHLVHLLEGESQDTMRNCLFSPYFSSILKGLDPTSDVAIQSVEVAFNRFRAGVEYIHQVSGH